MAKRKKRPYWRGEVACPECGAGLDVVVNRRRLGKPLPPDYDYDVRVEKVRQGALDLGDVKEKKDKVKVEKR